MAAHSPGHRGNLPIARPLLGLWEERAVVEVLRSRWLVQGERVRAFEDSVRRFAATKYAVAVSSGTSALHFCLRALGIGAGDDVLVPAFTFVATANAVLHAGGVPVFADIDLPTFNLSACAVSDTIERRYRLRGKRLTNRATGRVLRTMIVVHQFGLAADMTALGRIARRNRLSIIEDAACALGSTFLGKHVGHFGVASCLSFHPRKVVATGEGGMVLTERASFARAVRLLRDHGALQSDDERHRASVMAMPRYPVLGFNGRMTDIQGALGVTQMRRLRGMLRARERLATWYLKRLRDLPALALPSSPEAARHSWQSFVVRFPGNPRGRTRAANDLREEGIATRPGTHAVPWLENFAGTSTIDQQFCPNSLEAERTSLALPLYAEMTVADVDRVADALRRSLN